MLPTLHSLCCFLMVWPTPLCSAGNREPLGVVGALCAHHAVWPVHCPVSHLVLSVAISGDVATITLGQRTRVHPPAIHTRAAHNLAGPRLVVHLSAAAVRCPGGRSAARCSPHPVWVYDGYMLLPVTLTSNYQPPRADYQ